MAWLYNTGAGAKPDYSMIVTGDRKTLPLMNADHTDFR